MSKQKTREWLDAKLGKKVLTIASIYTKDELADLIHQYTKEQMRGWVSADTEKPEGPMAVDGYGFIVGGYSHGDQSRWTDIFYDNEKDVWWYLGEDMERVDITGFTMTHWTRPALPPTEEA